MPGPTLTLAGLPVRQQAVARRTQASVAALSVFALMLAQILGLALIKIYEIAGKKAGRHLSRACFATGSHVCTQQCRPSGRPQTARHSLKPVEGSQLSSGFLVGVSQGLGTLQGTKASTLVLLTLWLRCRKEDWGKGSRREGADCCVWGTLEPRALLSLPSQTYGH